MNEPALTDQLKYFEASMDDVFEVQAFLQPFFDQQLLLQRTVDEIHNLIRHAIIVRLHDQIVGFAAVEVYSRKLAEIQCLAVAAEYQRLGIGKQMVDWCIRRARELGVLELMAISNAEDFLRTCGFDYSLPAQKRAFFIQPQELND